jgi:hypothetical protein
MHQRTSAAFSANAASPGFERVASATSALPARGLSVGDRMLDPLSTGWCDKVRARSGD